MPLTYKKFSEVDLNDPFFDSLKEDYSEFSDWFARKADDHAYVFYNDSDLLEGFLYLKLEDGPVTDVEPPLPAARRIKLGTLKIIPHGTRLGERFVKKVFDHALAEGVDEVYVTVFEKHAKLIQLLERYGFESRAMKTSANGVEHVLVKPLHGAGETELKRYPAIKIGGRRIYLLSLKPNWHTRLLPDSILRTEDASIVQDVSHTNSIHKVYLTAMRDTVLLKAGDILVIYRTSDGNGSAYYRSVATSLCVVEEMKTITSFASKDEFMRYCGPYSVFSPPELEGFWRWRRYPYIFRFMYNFALPKRINRAKLIEDHGLNPDAYWGILPLTEKQFRSIVKASGLNESFIVD